MSEPKKLNAYLYMIRKELTKNSYLDLAESWGIKEDEAYECEQFISDSIRCNFMFTQPK